VGGNAIWAVLQSKEGIRKRWGIGSICHFANGMALRKENT